MEAAVGTVVVAGMLLPVYGVAVVVPDYTPASPAVHDDDGDGIRV